MNANPPAGWYPDPHGQAELRYWDGTTWTEHTSGEAVGAGPTQLDQPQAAAAPEAGAAQYESVDPYAAGGPAAGAAPGRTGGGPPKGLLIGLGALALVGVVVGVLFLTGVLGGGGDEESGKNDEEEIQAVIEDTLENYDDPDICDNWTDDYHETVEDGKDNCAPELEFNSKQDFEVGDIQVDGDEATAEVEIDNENEEIELKKEGDEWLIDSEVAGVCCVGGFAEGGTTTEDGDGTESGPEAEVRNVVDQWLSAIQTNNGTQFCANVTYNFMREHGVRGQDDQLTRRCENQADRIINDLIIASDPDIATIDVPSDSGFQTAKVTLTDTSKLDVVGEPGEYWLIDTFV